MEQRFADVGERLKETRKKRGFTQTRVQQETGIDQSELSKMEQGKRTPNLEQLARLAILYATSMDYLALQTDEIMPYPPHK